MRRPAVFFDRDNTLIVGHDYIGDPNRVELMPGAPAAIAKCRSMGFAVVVVSNQSGVARGMFTEVDVRACNRRLDALLLASNGGAVIDRHEYCPFHPEATVAPYRQDSFLRKPKPGMILAAAEAMALDLSQSWVVGDAPRDVAAGKAAGCRAILIVDPTLTPSPAALEKGGVAADFVVASLAEAVDVIVQQNNKPAPPPVPMPTEPVALSIAGPAEAPIDVAAPLSIRTDVEADPSSLRGGSIPGPVDSEMHPAPPAAPTSVQPAPPETRPDKSVLDLSRLENVSQQMLMELKKLHDLRHDDFSLSKLVAGITQILALAAVPLSYVMYRSDAQSMQSWLLVAIFLQLFTIAMLIMGRQR